MKRKVVLSSYCRTVSVLIIVALCCIFWWQLSTPDVGWPVWVLLGAIVFLCLSALFYAPVSVTVDDAKLSVRSPLRTLSIPLAGIAGVKLCSPTMSEKRLIGSGGFFGYYGIFTEPSIGRYIASYGKSSDCFLVMLKNGRKYILGCADAAQMVSAIQARLKHQPFTSSSGSRRKSKSPIIR